MATIVYVLNKDGKPLMPTTRNGHVGYLLRKKKARVVDMNPFTIQLVYETNDVVQDIRLGIDPGRTNIGLAAVKDDGECVFAAKAETRNKDVTDGMSKRSAHRGGRRQFGRRRKRQRRARKHGTVNKGGTVFRKLPRAEEEITCNWIINKESRFCNRARRDGWLTPTANHLLQTHRNLITKVKKILPISGISIEVNKFAFMALERKGLRPWDYQNGPLRGHKSVEDAVFELQEGKCLICGEPCIDHYHHVTPLHEGGSDGIGNRAGLCKRCHTQVHTDPKVKDKFAELHAGAKKKYAGTSVVNQIIPFLAQGFVDDGEDVNFVTGMETAEYRRAHGLDKDHHIDAYSIALIGFNDHPVIGDMVEHPYLVKQFRRHDRQVCNQQMVDRPYCLNGKVVAKNRHKRFEQKDDSLEEFLKKNPSIRPEMLTVKDHKPVYKRMDRIMPGTLMRYGKKVFVYKTGTPIIKGVPFYAVDIHGVRHPYKHCTPTYQNQGLKIIGRSA